MYTHTDGGIVLWYHQWNPSEPQSTCGLDGGQLGLKPEPFELECKSPISSLPLYCLTPTWSFVTYLWILDKN